MSGPGDVPPEILERLRPICRPLPGIYEEPAWIGVRWRVRKRTVAHVYTSAPERFPVHARHVADGEALTVMTFRVPVEDLLGLTSAEPFFRAPWGDNVAAVALGPHTDWTEIAEVVTDSYCEMAPKFLVARMTAPRGRDGAAGPGWKPGPPSSWCQRRGVSSPGRYGSWP